MDSILSSINYVAGDKYFITAMSLVAMSGMYIGAIIYDGLIEEIKRVTIVILSYAVLLTITNIGRLSAYIMDSTIDMSQPYAGTVSIFFVTIFYMAGMWLGVYIVNRAHNKK
jgi:hypothetical protein